MAYKFCPDCGFNLDKPYKFCPICGYALAEQAPAKKQTVDKTNCDDKAKSQEVAKAKTLCEQGKFDEALMLCEEMIKDDFLDVFAHAYKMVAITQNFTCFDEMIEVELQVLFNLFGKDKFVKQNANFANLQAKKQEALQTQKQKQADEGYPQLKKQAKQKFVEESKLSVINRADKVYFGMWPQSKKADEVKILGDMGKEGYYFGDDLCIYQKVGEEYFKFQKLLWDCCFDKTSSIVGVYICSQFLEVAKISKNGETSYDYSEIKTFMQGEFLEKAFAPFSIDPKDDKDPVKPCNVKNLLGMHVKFELPEDASLKSCLLNKKVDYYTRVCTPYMQAKIAQKADNGEFDKTEVHKIVDRFWAAGWIGDGKASTLSGKQKGRQIVTTNDYAAYVPVVRFQKSGCKNIFKVSW